MIEDDACDRMLTPVYQIIDKTRPEILAAVGRGLILADRRGEHGTLGYLGATLWGASDGMDPLRGYSSRRRRTFMFYYDRGERERHT